MPQSARVVWQVSKTVHFPAWTRVGIVIQSPYTSNEKRLMPALSGLQNQMSINPTQQESFDRNASRAKKIAEKVHLVHVSSAKEVSFDELLIQPPHAIPTSEHLTYCSDATRRAENLLGLARSAYFYAGRACPAFGDLALAFEPPIENGHTVSVSSIETGGLVHPNRYIKCEVAGADEDAARVEFGKACEIKELDWRGEFARFLAGYFDPLADYWNGRPAYEDPEKVFTLGDDSRAWTFEVRFAEPQPIVDCVAWTAKKSQLDLLRRKQAAQPVAVPGDPISVLDQFLNQPPLNPVGSDVFCEELESWIVGQVGV